MRVMVLQALLAGMVSLPFQACVQQTSCIDGRQLWAAA